MATYSGVGIVSLTVLFRRTLLARVFAGNAHKDVSRGVGVGTTLDVDASLGVVVVADIVAAFEGAQRAVALAGI